MEAGLSLGSNLGDRLARLREAAERIDTLPDTRITARSHIYETAPVGVHPRYRDLAYLNAVLIVETALDTDVLSESLHTLETRMGRIRTEDRFAPRTIDIDILYVDGIIRHDDALTLPHPRWAERRFVLQPLADVRPDLIFPERSLTVAHLLKALDEPPETVRAIPESWG